MSEGMTLAQKILARQSGRESVAVGDIVWAEPNTAMMDDPLGPKMIQEDLVRLGNRIRYPDRVVVISDHCAPPSTVPQADLLTLTRNWAKTYQIARFHEYEGICHQVMVEKGYVLPGELVVGTDSHTVMGGALGAFATGIGSTEMLGVLVTGELWFRVPQTVRIEWEGTMPDGVMAKDLILQVLGDFGNSGLTYRAVEFGGSLVDTMAIDQRLCLSNMTVEAGAKAGLIPPDDTTREYLAERIPQEIENAIKWLVPDADAVYETRKVYASRDMQPLVAVPHHPGNVHPIDAVCGERIDQAYIGSCAGGRLSDLEAAATILKGRRVAPGVRLIVCPASRTVYQEALQQGILQVLFESGAIITAAGCGACGGGHSGVLGANEVCISSTNRNFKGRMGDPASQIFLASPLSVAAAAVVGEIVDPRTLLG